MPKITFITTGATYEVPAGTRFVEFCQENDAPHDFGCTVGSCGTCRAVLEAGADNVNPITVVVLPLRGPLDDLPVTASYHVAARVRGFALEDPDAPVEVRGHVLLHEQEVGVLQHPSRLLYELPEVIALEDALGERAVGARRARCDR